MATQNGRRKFAENTFILKEGERSDAAFMIMNGKVEIRLGAFGDNPQTLAVLGKGDVIGEMSLFDDSPHMASAVSIEKTEVSALSADEFKKRVEDMDPFMRGVTKIMVNRVRQMGESMKAKKTEVNWADWNKR